MYLSTIVSFIMTVYPVVMLGFLFEKCGERGWKALIPFYSTYIYFKLAKAKVLGIVMMILMAVGIAGAIYFTFTYYEAMNSLIESGTTDSPTVALILSSTVALIFLFVISLAAGVIQLIGNYKLGKQFGQDGGFLVGMMFLPVIFESILAFSSSYRYDGMEYDWSTF